MHCLRGEKRDLDSEHAWKACSKESGAEHFFQCKMILASDVPVLQTDFKRVRTPLHQIDSNGFSSSLEGPG